MHTFWKNHRTKIALVALLALPLSMVSVSAGAEVGASTSFVGSLGGRLVGWTHALAHSALSAGGGVVGSLFESQSDRRVEELEAQVAKLTEDKNRLIGVLQENERLRKLLEFRERRQDLEVIPARVIGRSVSPYFRVLKIKLDASDLKLKPRMPVVVSEGVVGQIHKVYGPYADVLLVSDPRHRVDAIAQRTRAQAIVEGLGHEADYRARMAYLRERDEVRVGDVVVTSGMDQIFPPDLSLGVIEEVSRDEHKLFQDAVLSPTVDFGRLTEVFIVRRAGE